MAQSKLSPQEFIKNAFTPQIAVLCSPSVEQICQKNNLSFVELVQPFCKLSADVNLQDANGSAVMIHNLKVKLMDVNSRPPQPTLARKFLNAAVAQSPDPRTQQIQIVENSLQIPASTPWFEAWRDTFLQVQFPSDHEFTKHYLACMLVVSSADVNPVETVNHLDQNLNQLQNIIPNKLPKWFSTFALRYYVLVHDNTDGDDSKATQVIDALNLVYGIGKVFLLKINSRPQGKVEEQLPDPWSQYVSKSFETTESNRTSPDDSPNISRSMVQSFEEGVQPIESGDNLYHPLSPETETLMLNEAILEKEIQIDCSSTNALHGMCLTTSDVEQIKLLIHEFCTRALIPYVERQIQNLTEIVSNKKGVSKSLLSATKRWFTPSKVGSSNGSLNMPTYSADAPEIQMRKLGDLYFMFGHYTMAFQVYHAAKRDFNSDQAWFYYAGALEMAALAAFMANESSRKTCDYIEESIVTYLNVCKMHHFATRATLLSSECLKSRNLHGEAAHQLIRMTSEESDLRSALLLEQAAYCFLNCSRLPMLRKYAFHMVLAGHRFSKAAQKKHALRCYKQALEVYQKKGWSFAEDHVHYTIGKLSLGLNFLQPAAESFSKLLTIQSKQSVEQQTLFLKDYLSTQRIVLESGFSQESPILSLPILESEATKILVGPTPPLSIPGKVRALGISFSTCDDRETKQKWLKLEEMLVQEAQGSLPLIFKPAITLYTKDNISNANLNAIINEPIQVSLKLYNPLSVTINLKNIYLLWRFKNEDGSIITNEQTDNNSDNFLKTNVIKSFVLSSNSSQDIILSITPLKAGNLLLRGIYYSVLDLDKSEDVTAVSGKQLFDFKKMGYTKKEVIQNVNVDHNIGLPIFIMPPAPCLQVSFEEINSDMLCNEIKSVMMEMRNVGSVPLHKVFIATSTPQLLSSCEFRESTRTTRELVDLDIPHVRERFARKNHVTQVALPNNLLEPGQSYSVNIWIKAPNVKGPMYIDLLIYYENFNSNSIPRYRLIRHVWILKIYESLEIELGVVESSKSENIKELLFEVKAINMNKVYINNSSEITLLKAGLLSSYWKLKPLEKLRDSNSLTVNSEQSTYILLRGERRISQYDKYCEVPLVNHCSAAKNLAFVDFAKGIEQSKINIFEDTVITKNKFKEGMLFFQWKARVIDNFKIEKIGIGQTVVAIERFKSNDENGQDVDKTILLYDSNQSAETQVPKKERDSTNDLCSQISLGIIHNSSVDHDFKNNQVCIIPIKISIHNDSHIDSIITVNTSGTNSVSPPSLRPNLFCPYPSKDYRWVGFSGTIKTISSLSSEMITLHVAVTSPGVYDLGGRLELWCQNDLHPEPVLQDLQALGFLIVRNVNERNVVVSDAI